MAKRIDKGLGGPEWSEGVGASEEGASVAGADAAAAAYFDALLGLGDAGAAGAALPAELEPLQAIVDDVAAQMRAGAIVDPDAACAAVVERAVAMRFEGLDARTQRRMVADLRDALLDDPFFVLEVEALIGHAIGALGD